MEEYTRATVGELVMRRQVASLRREVGGALVGSWRLAPVVVALVGIWTLFTFLSPVFLTSENMTNLTKQIAVTATIGLALFVILIVRHIDISLVALSAVCATVAARLVVEAHWNVAAAIFGALVVGAAFSTALSVFVTVFRAPAFIVSLGGLFLLNAALLWLLPPAATVPLADTSLENIAGTSLPIWPSYALAAVAVLGVGALRWSYHHARLRERIPSNIILSTVIPTGTLAAVLAVALVLVYHPNRGVPTPAVILLGLMTVFGYIAGQTPFGRYLYAIGGNPEAARRAGIRIGVVTTVAFALAGSLAALAGVIAASRQLGVSPESSDLTLLLDALAAVVIGGVSLFGGRGSVWGVLLGSLIIGSISNGLFLINASTQIRWTIEGVVLIIAVVVDAVIIRRGSSS